MKKENILAQIPQIDKLLQKDQIKKLLDRYPRVLVLDIIRDVIQHFREQVLANNIDDIFKQDNNIEKYLIDKISESTEIRLRERVQRCINTTGIILHTGLGRAPLSAAAQTALSNAAAGFTVVEYELDSGKRGDRHELVEDLIIKLTGAEAAAVFNNNAAATFLTLNTLSFEKESIISRGELVTIGGSFRIPDIMKKSGSYMVDVGTTNKTNCNDYEQAISENTGLLVKVHTSNYKIVGFHDEAHLNELVELGKKHNIPVFHDLGSGSIVDLSRFGLPKEPVVSESVEGGADVITFSGDKLLGGPQAGIVVGKKKYIDQIKQNQLARTLRCDKLIFAALEATLRLFFDEEKLLQEHRVTQLLTQKISVIEKRAEKLKSGLEQLVKEKGKIEIEPGYSQVGGGSLADEALDTKLITLSIKNIHEEKLSYQLRQNIPPIITRIKDDKVVFDLFTISDDEIDIIITAIKKILGV